MFSKRITGRRVRWAIGAAVVLASLSACNHLMHMVHGSDVARPGIEEFGYGPRASAAGVYSATVEPVSPIQVGRMHSWRLRVVDAQGHAIDSVAIAVDGGMPEHGHGLPTRPRVTRSLGSGVYQVDGMKFNMGGWWEVTFRIAGAAGADSVTFNLDL